MENSLDKINKALAMVEAAFATHSYLREAMRAVDNFNTSVVAHDLLTREFSALVDIESFVLKEKAREEEA